MSKTNTPETEQPSRTEQPTTAASVASEAIQSIDAVSFDAYDGRTRQSILSLLERLVQADQGARLAAESEHGARRQLIVDLLDPGTGGGSGGPSEQKMTTLVKNLSNARVLSGDDSVLVEQFIDPSLIEMAIVIPGRSPVFANSRSFSGSVFAGPSRRFCRSRSRRFACERPATVAERS